MKALRVIFSLTFVLGFCISLACFVPAADDFIRSDAYTAEEYEDMSYFDMSVAERTSFFNWRDKDGVTPERYQVKGLGGYMLSASSDSCIGEFFSSPSSPLDIYDYREISFVARVICGEYETFRQNCSVVLTLRSGDKTLECVANISSGVYNVVTFDVSFWKYRKSIDSIEVCFVGEDNSLPLVKIELSGPYVDKSEQPAMRKFMSYGLYASGAELVIFDKGTEKESLNIELGSQRVVLRGLAAVPYTEETCNAVQIRISNASELRTLRFGYSYLDVETGYVTSKAQNIEISPMSGVASYYVHTGEVSFIKDFSIALDSATGGQVKIHSIKPVAVYEGYAEDTFAAINERYVDNSEKKVVISGSVFHNYLINHTDHSLVLFVLSKNQSFYEAVEGGKSYSAISKMSSRFNFEIKLGDLGAYASVSQYAVASLSPEGEYTLLLAPFSLEGDYAVAETEKGRNNIKGLECDDFSLAVDTGAGYAIVDVYLDKLAGVSVGGHIYTIDGTFLYFDSDYVKELDLKIKNLYAAGCKVYLRLLISAESNGNGLPFAVKESGDEAELLAVTLRDAESEKSFYAFVDFLASRYSKTVNGRITGLILGKSINEWERYNYSDTGNIVEYAKEYAKAFSFMARCAAGSISSLEVLLPVSDCKGDAVGYNRELLLISVCRYLSDEGGFDYSVLYESKHSADPVKESVDFDGDHVEYDNIAEFEMMLENLSGLYESAPKTYMYLWTPSKDMTCEKAVALYVYNYFSVMFSDKASAFILSSSENESGNLFADEFLYLIKYIDTEMNTDGSLCASALDFFGAEKWEQIIENYDSSLITYRIFNETVSPDNLPEDIKGSYPLWDFSTAFGVLDWFGGSRCASLSLDSTYMGEKTLCAVSRGEGSQEYSEIVYNFEYPENIKDITYITFDFVIEDGGLDCPYEVRVICGDKEHRLETLKTVNSGAAAFITIATDQCKGMEKLDYIRFCVRRTDETESGDFRYHISKINAESNKKSSEELKKAIGVSRALAKNTQLDIDGSISEEPQYEIIIAIVIVIILGVAMVGFYERKQR